MDELFTLALQAYLALAFIKFMLCVPHIPRVISTVSRLRGSPRGKCDTLYVIIVPILVAILSLLGWVKSLRDEGVRFFVMYNSFGVMRDCVRAVRAATLEDEG